jgi:hypothetical protein
MPARTAAHFLAGEVPLFSASPVAREDHRAAHLVAAGEGKP